MEARWIPSEDIEVDASGDSFFVLLKLAYSNYNYWSKVETI